MILNIAVVVIAYFLGAIPSGYIIGKCAANIDIREHGSGNVGATNSFRLLGAKLGILVLICDISKGFVAAAIAGMICGLNVAIIAALVAIIGHTLSVFIKFKGGKGVATYAGAMLYLDPLIVGFGAIVFFPTLLLTGYVSLASVLSGVFVIIYGIFFISNIWLKILVVGTAIYIIYKHRSNISRLLKGTENKIDWRRVNDKK